MNEYEYFSHQHRCNTVKTVKSRKAQRAPTTALKDTLMKKHTALKQTIKNDTCIELRRDIKSTDTVTLLADSLPLLLAIYSIVEQR